MNSAAAVAWLRRAIALLLLACLVLPLARCDKIKEPLPPVPVPNGTAIPGPASAAVPVQENKPVYAGKIIVDMVSDVGEMKLADVPHGAIMLVIFFAPLLSLFFRPIIQSCIHAAAGPPSLAYLVVIVFFWFGEPMAGGLLAIASWVVLLALGVRGILAHDRSRATAAPA